MTFRLKYFIFYKHFGKKEYFLFLQTRYAYIFFDLFVNLKLIFKLIIFCRKKKLPKITKKYCINIRNVLQYFLIKKHEDMKTSYIFLIRSKFYYSINMINI